MFLSLLLSLTLEDAEFWLKVISGELAAFTLVVFISALVTGHFVNERANERTAKAQAEAAKASESAEEARRRIEAERIIRENFENSLAPRSFPVTLANKDLDKFAGTKVALLYVNNESLGDEPLRTAREIAETLQTRRWKVLWIRPDPKLPPLGIEVLSKVVGFTPNAQPARDSVVHTPKFAVTLELEKKLTLFKIYAKAKLVWAGWFHDVPDDVIVIRVGIKPDWYAWNKQALSLLEIQLGEEKDAEKRKELEQQIEALKKAQESPMKPE